MFTSSDLQATSALIILNTLQPQERRPLDRDQVGKRKEGRNLERMAEEMDCHLCAQINIHSIVNIQ